MKNDGRLRRNWLKKGSLGDALHAVLCGAGHNLRMILRAPCGFISHFFWPDYGAVICVADRVAKILTRNF